MQREKIGLGLAEIINDKREAILRLADEHGAYNVRVFGSVARGEAGAESDVDVWVSLRRGVSIFSVVGLWQDLSDLLGREVDLVTDGGIDAEFRAAIEKDAVHL